MVHARAIAGRRRRVPSGLFTGLADRGPAHDLLRHSPTVKRTRDTWWLWSFAALLALGCGPLPELDADEAEPELDSTSIEQGLVTCGTRQDTGYTNGTPFTITVVTADGKPAEMATANAYSVMQAEAARAGVTITVVSGFRTMAEQQYLYACYVNCNCNSCNLAARPGYSNHQSGHALDLNTSAPGVYNWLAANAGRFGFSRTVPSEPWHWEWWGGGPGGGPCGQQQPPPNCDRTAGLFTFSCDGVQANQHCVQLNEPSDPDTWSDNYLCSDDDWGLRWSYAGPIDGMDCTGVHESAEPLASIWADNFLCAPKQSPLEFTWSSAGPISGKTCVLFNEPLDQANSWGDNYLCYSKVTRFTEGGLTFSSSGAVDGLACTSVDEPSDPNTWADNVLCSRPELDLGLRWSYAGPIAGLDCTNIAESAEHDPAIWKDNFLCVPPQAPLGFSWSTAGPLAGQQCVRWFEWADLAGSWGDNWLCWVPLTDFSGGGLTFSSDGPNPGQTCVSVDEPEDPHGWQDNHLCTTLPLGLVWSTHGPLSGWDCTHVAAPGETHAGWDDDYVCVMKGAEYGLTLSTDGPLDGQQCARWYEAGDVGGGWPRVYLCARYLPPEERTRPGITPAPPPHVVTPLGPTTGAGGGDGHVPGGGVMTGGCAVVPGPSLLALALGLLAWRRRAWR